MKPVTAHPVLGGLHTPGAFPSKYKSSLPITNKQLLKNQPPLDLGQRLYIRDNAG